MCSVSWLLEEDGYQVFFNRDEQKTRPLALAPRPLQIKGARVLMPIDPQAKGTWISLNEAGLTLCLLNNYQGTTPTKALISRGQLVKCLSSEPNVLALKTAFDDLELTHFAPFTLLVFDASLTESHGNVMAFEWDGKYLKVFPERSPRFSSGVDLEQVSAARRSAYQNSMEQGISYDTLLELHASHHSEQPHQSFCMHRADAHTVSFTHVKVTADERSMAYSAGCPCESLDKESLEMQRISLESKQPLDLLIS